MTHAIVLIEAERGAMPDLGGALADVEGVAEAWSVTGEWDYAAMLRVRSPDEIAVVVTGRLAQLPGIKRTHTMVAFEVFSKHDLEALFSSELGFACQARRSCLALAFGDDATRRCQRRFARTEQAVRSCQSCTISTPPAATSR